MLNNLQEIRNNLLEGVESKDMLYLKMQINRLDMLIHKLSLQDNVVLTIKQSKSNDKV